MRLCIKINMHNIVIFDKDAHVTYKYTTAKFPFPEIASSYIYVQRLHNFACLEVLCDSISLLSAFCCWCHKLYNNTCLFII